MTTTAPLSPTDRTRIVRGRRRALDHRSALFDVLSSARICHLGLVVDGSPRVLPTVYGVRPDGPDDGGTLYLHGSVAARSLVEAPSSEICVTVTVVDGLVLARSAFHHSMNYRSAVVLGTPRIVDDPDERAVALDLIVDQVLPGRAAHLRAHTAKELAATRVLALPLFEASVKARDGAPEDYSADVAAGGVWAGVVPASEALGPPVTSGDVEDGVTVPGHVADLIRAVSGVTTTKSRPHR